MFLFSSKEICVIKLLSFLCVCFLFFYIKTEEKTVKHGQGKQQGQILVYV